MENHLQNDFLTQTPLSDIIHSPQFQRLKKIKQLGLMDRTMPSARTSRYDHCKGTCRLAYKMLESLQRKGAEIDGFYKMTVLIAALLHDIGHGPFSHSWEYICDYQYNHEYNSFGCIDEIFKRLECIKWAGNRGHYAVELIKGLIVGDSSCLIEGDEKYAFLFEIVNNRKCGIDVDKWDYLIRDYVYAREYTQCLPVNVDFDDVFMEARVSIDGTHIEYRYCDFEKIYNIFDARSKFHICFYRRPLVVCLENIFKHIISENDDLQLDRINIRDIRSEHGNLFCKFNDDAIWRIIQRLTSPEMQRLVNCVLNASITTSTSENTDEPYLKVETCIGYAGEDMKTENISFYGNEKDKPTFSIKRGYHKSISYFEIMA